MSRKPRSLIPIATVGSENPRDIQLAWQKQGAIGPPPPLKPFRPSRRFFKAVVYVVIGTSIAAGIAGCLVYSIVMTIPTDEETMTMFEPEPGTLAAEVESYIQSHPLTKSCLADPDFLPARPHLKQPPSLRINSLTSGALLGEDKMEVPPLTFATRDGSRYVSIQYLGPALCGHPGIVHGGFLATLLDEGLARCCFPALPSKVGVTASLKMDYLAPCKASQYVVLRAETTKVDGRKAWVKGWIETLPEPDEWEVESLNGEPTGTKPVKLVHAEALFVEPKKMTASSASLKNALSQLTRIQFLMNMYASKSAPDANSRTSSDSSPPRAT